MENENPTNETLKVMIEMNQKSSEERHREVMQAVRDGNTELKEVRVQTTKTNGRVTKLEAWRTGIAWFFGFMVGMFAFAVTFGVPYLLKIIAQNQQIVAQQAAETAIIKQRENNQVEFQSMIDQSIETFYQTQYEIQVLKK